MPPAKNADPEEIKIIRLRPLEERTLNVDIEGVTPVIPHRWSEKALKMMRDKQMASAGSLSTKKEPKNPDEEANDSCYWITVDGEQHGAIPSVSFKAAMVGACRFYEGITMVQAKLLFFVEGQGSEQLVPLNGPWGMREDTPRNSGGVADLRYRMQFWPWTTSLRVKFLPSMIGPESVLALVNAAGKLGVGDWRPSSPKSASGTYGQFRVVGGDQ